MNVPSFTYAGKRALLIFFITCLSLSLGNTYLSAQNGSTYYLIAGSFNTLSSAQKGQIQIESTYGRRAELLFPDSRATSRYRVSLYSSGSRSEVSAYSNSLKQKGLKPGWILEMKSPSFPSPVMRGSGANQRLKSESYARNGYETYYLITGSFKTFEQADRDRLKKIEQGFEAEILFPEKEAGFYKVSVFYSTNRKQIDRYAALLKRQGNQGWIYTAAPNQFRSGDTNRDNAKLFNATAPEIQDLGKVYHIIGGSFKSFEQASQLEESLQRKGIAPKIIFPKTDGGNFRVSLYQSTNHGEVKARNAQLKKEGILKNGWILAE